MRKVIAVYDHPKFFDRFTIVLNPDFMQSAKHTIKHCCIGVSSNAGSAQGFSQIGECEVGEHLGSRISLRSLPYALRAHIKGRLAE